MAGGGEVVTDLRVAANLIDRRRVQRFYERYVERHGVSAGWSSMETARAVYAAASGHPAQRWPEMASVLDVGSGQGHLARFLRIERGFGGRYSGIELLPTFYEAAVASQGDFPAVDFVCDEFLAHDFAGRIFDWVFSLGSLAVVQEDSEAHDRAVLEKMVRLARTGITVYLNDRRRMRPERLRQVEDLAAHDIPDFVEHLGQSCTEIEVVRPFGPRTQHVLVHALIPT